MKERLLESVGWRTQPAIDAIAKFAASATACSRSGRPRSFRSLRIDEGRQLLRRVLQGAVWTSRILTSGICRFIALLRKWASICHGAREGRIVSRYFFLAVKRSGRPPHYCATPRWRTGKRGPAFFAMFSGPTLRSVCAQVRRPVREPLAHSSATRI